MFVIALLCTCSVTYFFACYLFEYHSFVVNSEGHLQLYGNLACVSCWLKCVTGATDCCFLRVVCPL